MLRRQKKDYHESDFCWNEHSIVCQQHLKASDAASAEDYTNDCTKIWDIFYGKHSVKFFKPKMYLPEAYPEIIDNLSVSKSESIVLIDFGCGHGGSCVSFLMDILCFEPAKDISFVGLDTSSVAIGNCEWYLQDKFASHQNLKLHLKTADLTQPVSLDVPLGISGLIIFTLSAAPPIQFGQFLKNVSNLVEENGVIAFRDYALYDMVHMRCVRKQLRKIKTTLDIPTFEKEDGVLVTFFTIEYLKELFLQHGFETIRIRYSTVELKNKKSLEKMRRCFVSAVFRKRPKCDIEGK